METQESNTDHAALATGAVVVGFDDSTYSEAAVAWAADEAELTGRRLVLLHAADVSDRYSEFWAGGVAVDHYRVMQDVERETRRMLEGVAARVHKDHPDLEVLPDVVLMDARHALLEAAEHASVMAVGSRGRGRIASLLLGSVSAAVSRHAACPVVVLRPGAQEHTGGIVVGVDGRPSSRPVLEFAFQEATHRGKPLTVLHTHVDQISMAYGLHVNADVAEVDEAFRTLAEAVAGFAEEFPDVEVTRTVRGQEVDRALLTADEDASMLVVGRRHLGTLHASVHSGIATAVLEHAGTAVAVVPTP